MDPIALTRLAKQRALSLENRVPRRIADAAHGAHTATGQALARAFVILHEQAVEATVIFLGYVAGARIAQEYAASPEREAIDRILSHHFAQAAGAGDVEPDENGVVADKPDPRSLSAVAWWAFARGVA